MSDDTEVEEVEVEEEESYESWTVAELKDELATRDLHTSGNKDELIARLEEDDAAEESEGGEGTSKELVAQEPEAQDAPLIDPPRVYSPYQLPADPFAAQAFMDAHPESVDTELTLEPAERQALAEANIQDAVDAYAAMGVTVEDPRLGGDVGNPPDGGGGEPATPTISGISPTSGTGGTTVTVTGTHLSGTTQVTISLPCTNLNVVSDIEVQGDTDPTIHKGYYPVIVTVDGTDLTGPTFQAT